MLKPPNQEDSASSGVSVRKTTKNKNLLTFLKSVWVSMLASAKCHRDDSAFCKIVDDLKINSNKMTAQEKDLFNNFLQFGQKIVEDVMIPRSDITAVRHDVTLEELSDIIVRVSHARILVFKDTLDDIVGFVHIKDLFRIVAKKQTFQLRKLLRKQVICAPSMKLNLLLTEMQKKCTHIAVVVDEYGGTDGIVTFEDIMEEIVGRIEDEHDQQLESDSYEIIDSGAVLCSARVEVETIEHILGVNLKGEDDEFDTIGGLVLAKVGNVPLPGDKIMLSEQVELEVIDASPRTLKQVKLRLRNE